MRARPPKCSPERCRADPLLRLVALAPSPPSAVDSSRPAARSNTPTILPRMHTSRQKRQRKATQRTSLLFSHPRPQRRGQAPLLGLVGTTPTYPDLFAHTLQETPVVTYTSPTFDPYARFPADIAGPSGLFSSPISNLPVESSLNHMPAATRVACEGSAPPVLQHYRNYFIGNPRRPSL